MTTREPPQLSKQRPILAPEPPESSPRLQCIHGTAMLGMIFDKFIAVGSESRLTKTVIRENVENEEASIENNMEEDMKAGEKLDAEEVMEEDGKGEDMVAKGGKGDMEIDEDEEIIYPKNCPGFMKYAREDYKKVRAVSADNNVVIGMAGDRYMGVELLRQLQDKLLRKEKQRKKTFNTSECARYMLSCNDKLIGEKRITDDYEIMLAGYDGKDPKIYMIDDTQGLSSYDDRKEEDTIMYAGCGGPDAADFIKKAKWYRSDLPPSFVADRFCDALRHAAAKYPKNCGGLIRVYIITSKGVECVKYISEEQVGEVGCVVADGEDFMGEGYATDDSWCTA